MSGKRPFRVYGIITIITIPPKIVRSPSDTKRVSDRIDSAEQLQQSLTCHTTDRICDYLFAGRLIKSLLLAISLCQKKC